MARRQRRTPAPTFSRGRLNRIVHDAMASLEERVPRPIIVRPRPQKETPAMSTARFGHHENPAEDFIAEVEEIAGLVERAKDMKDPLPSWEALRRVQRRINAAMEFRVGGVPEAVDAKNRLRDLEEAFAKVEGPDPLAPVKPPAERRARLAAVTLMMVMNRPTTTEEHQVLMGEVAKICPDLTVTELLGISGGRREALMRARAMIDAMLGELPPARTGGHG